MTALFGGFAWKGREPDHEEHKQNGWPTMLNGCDGWFGNRPQTGLGLLEDSLRACSTAQLIKRNKENSASRRDGDDSSASLVLDERVLRISGWIKEREKNEMLREVVG